MTSIEWLRNELIKLNIKVDHGTQVSIIRIFEQAKEMHKAEILKAFDESQECYYQYLINHKPKIDSETYHQETFGSKDINGNEIKFIQSLKQPKQ